MSTPGAHRRRSRFPSLWLWIGLIVLIGAAAWFRVTGDDDLRATAAVDRPARSASMPVPSATLTKPAATSSSPTAGPTPARGKLVIHGTGDVNLDPSYITTYAANGYGYAWSGLQGLFREDDLTVVNLECAVSDLGSPLPKQFTFRGDPAALPAMRRAGVEAASLANNHSYDFGPTALVDTRKNLLANDIQPVGAGKNQHQALAPAVFEIEGWTVAVVGFDKVVDPYPDAIATDAKPGTAAGHDEDLMVDTVRGVAKDAGIVVVMIHWGVELDTQPRGADVDLGHRLIDAGADMIFGGHAHRLQPMETYRGRPIFYSLGNFVWPNFSVAGSTTAVAEVTVSPKGRVTGRLLPALITSPGHPVLTG